MTRSIVIGFIGIVLTSMTAFAQGKGVGNIAKDEARCMAEYKKVSAALWQSEEDLSVCESGNSDLIYKIEDLSNQHNNLLISNEELSYQYNELLSTNKGLTDQHNNLVSSYEELSDQYNNLLNNSDELKTQIESYIHIISPETPYNISDNGDCINLAQKSLKNFIKKAKAGVRRLKIPRKTIKALNTCYANEKGNKEVFQTLKSFGLNLK